MKNIVNIKTKKPMKIAVDRETFFDVLDAIEHSIEKLPIVDRTKAKNIIVEIKWNAYSNPSYRKKYYPDLEELLLELYERVS